MNLLHETLELLKSDARSLPQIAKDAGLSFHWVSKVSQGAIESPGVQKIQLLHDHLLARQESLRDGGAE
jgi:hypothetical protein